MISWPKESASSDLLDAIPWRIHIFSMELRDSSSLRPSTVPHFIVVHREQLIISKINDQSHHYITLVQKQPVHLLFISHTTGPEATNPK